MRLNALRHGILARDVVAGVEQGIESREKFEDLRAALQSQLEAKQALALLLVDQLAALAWRWRRPIRYETVSIASGVADVQLEQD